MSKLLISVKDAAAEDIEAAFLWYENKSAGLGERFRNEVKAYVNKIASYPHNYSFVKNFKPIRKILLKHFPYAVFYIVLNHSIDILGVIHASRSDQFIRQRLL